ncbi:MAG TPA: hypothetical protein EYH12_04885 [Psychromonas hadalis]|nr:hypothetical protein [Psychromonas hadalis]
MDINQVGKSTSDELELTIKKAEGREKSRLRSCHKFYAKAVSLGWTFSEGVKWLGTANNVEMTCRYGHLNQKNPNGFMSGYSKCLECKLQAEKNTVDRLFSKKKIVRVGPYLAATKKIQFRCELDDKTWEVTPMNLLSGKQAALCPHCNAYGDNSAQSAQLLIQSLSVNNEIKAYKFGVTHNETLMRLKRKNVQSDYTRTLVAGFHFDGEGDQCLALKNENRAVLNALGNNPLTKE